MVQRGKALVCEEAACMLEACSRRLMRDESMRGSTIGEELLLYLTDNEKKKKKAY
jgi:hypothetical protein